MKKKMEIFAAALLVVFLTVNLCGCSAGSGEQASNNSGGAYSLSVAWPDESGRNASLKTIPSGSTSISLSITGQGIPEADPITASIEAGTTTLTITNIPVGPKVALIKSLNASGATTAQRKESFTIITDHTTTADHVPLGVAVTGNTTNPIFEPSGITINYNSPLYVQNWLETSVTIKGFTEASMTLPAATASGETSTAFPSDNRTIKSIENVIVNDKGIMNVAMKATRYKIYVSNLNSACISAIENNNGNLSSSGTIPVGSLPVFGIYTPVTGLFYTGCDFTNSNIWTINPETNATDNFSSTSSTAAWGFKVKPGTNILYCCNQNDNNVSRIRLSDNYVFPDKIAVGTDALMPDLTIGGDYLYVPCFYSSNVYVINTNTNQVYGSPIAVGSGAGGAKANPNGKYVYVRNYDDGTVSVIDTAIRESIKTIAVGDNPWGIETNLDGSRVYVTNNGGNTVSVIETTNNTISNTITVGAGPAGIALSPDGNYLYVVNGANRSASVGYSMSIIDVSTETVLNTVSEGYSFSNPFYPVIIPIQ